MEPSKKLKCLRKLLLGDRPKKLTFLADMPAKAFSPPPCLELHMSENVSFFLLVKKYIFLKRECSETDDYVNKTKLKISGFERKILSRNFNTSSNNFKF